MSEVVPITAHLAWRWHPRRLTLPDSLTNAERVLGITIGRPIAFCFCRCKEGTEVWLFFSHGLRLNLSSQMDTYPPSFKHARYWAHQFAKEHGIPAKETKWR